MTSLVRKVLMGNMMLQGERQITLIHPGMWNIKDSKLSAHDNDIVNDSRHQVCKDNGTQGDTIK